MALIKVVVETELLKEILSACKNLVWPVKKLRSTRCLSMDYCKVYVAVVPLVFAIPDITV